MNKLSESLQKHPVIVLVMFLLSSISALVTIALGWKEFYSSFLSKEINLPVWMIFLMILLGAITYIFRGKRTPNLKEFETIEGKEFGVQPVEMDGKNFVNCTFDGSELVFRGTNGFNLQKNHFKTPPRISFQDYAATTMVVVKALHKDPSFRPYIEKTLE